MDGEVEWKAGADSRRAVVRATSAADTRNAQLLIYNEVFKLPKYWLNPFEASRLTQAVEYSQSNVYGLSRPR